MKKHTFKRLLVYFNAHRLRLFFVLLFASVSTVFTVMAPFVIGKITTTLFDSIRDGVFYWETILWLLATLVCLYFISQFFSFLQGFHMAKITVDVMREIRSEIDGKMHRLKLNYYDTHTHGDILSVITNDVDTINNTVSQNLTSIVTQVITAAGILFMMQTISPKLTLIPVIMVPLSLLSAAGVMKSGGKYYGKQQELLGQLNGYIEEMYNGQQIVQAFTYQGKATQRFHALNEELKYSSYKAETTAGAVSPITTFVNDTGYVVCAAIGCLRAIGGFITVGNVQAMLYAEAGVCAGGPERHDFFDYLRGTGALWGSERYFAVCHHYLAVYGNCQQRPGSVWGIACDRRPCPYFHTGNLKYCGGNEYHPKHRDFLAFYQLWRDLGAVFAGGNRFGIERFQRDPFWAGIKAGIRALPVLGKEW